MKTKKLLGFLVVVLLLAASLTACNTPDKDAPEYLSMSISRNLGIPYPASSPMKGVNDELAGEEQVVYSAIAGEPVYVVVNLKIPRILRSCPSP